VLQVATRLDDVNEPTRIVVRSLAVAMPGVVVLIALLVWWLVGRTLRPVERIRAEMADITVHDLSRRVPEPGTGDDIDRLARTTNTTLATLEQAVARQQRFVADASHELRSPIARMRAALEVDQVDPAAADLAATHRGLLDDTVALQQLVEDLLHLTRSDARVAKARPPARVDLDVVLRNEVAAVSERGRVAVRVGAIDAAAVEGQPHELARAVRNLLDNAERHAASLVTVALTVLDGAAHLTIADDGPGIPIADRERVFERFARLDDARTIASGGTGLGLAITREIVADHRGTVVVEGDGETRLVVTLPLAPAVAVQPSFSPAGA
jgi:signal transduction histidine kinase